MMTNLHASPNDDITAYANNTDEPLTHAWMNDIEMHCLAIASDTVADASFV